MKARQESAREKYKVLLARPDVNFSALYEETQGWRFSGANGEDLAREMVNCLPDVESLLHMPNDIGVEPGYNLMMFPARHVHNELNMGGGAVMGIMGTGMNSLMLS